MMFQAIGAVVKAQLSAGARRQDQVHWGRAGFQGNTDPVPLAKGGKLESAGTGVQVGSTLKNVALNPAGKTLKGSYFIHYRKVLQEVWGVAKGTPGTNSRQCEVNPFSVFYPSMSTWIQLKLTCPRIAWEHPLSPCWSIPLPLHK